MSVLTAAESEKLAMNYAPPELPPAPRRSAMDWPLRIFWWIVTWFPLHLALVVLGFYSFNRAIYNHDMVLSRRMTTEYSQYSMPLYVRPDQADPKNPSDEDWIASAKERLHDAHRMAPPIVFFLIWLGIVIVQLKWRIAPPWAWVVTCFAFVLFINLTVCCMKGPDAIIDPFSRLNMDYYGDVSKVTTPAEFARDYPELNRDHTINHHSATHPPGGVLFLWCVDQLFGPEGRWGHFDGLWTSSVAAIVVTALGIIPVYFLSRRLYGAKVATIASALWAVTPNLVLFGATCMDGVFMILPLVALWMFFKGVKDRPIVYGILFGLALAAALFMTFAAVCIGIITTIYGILALIFSRPDMRGHLLHGLTWRRRGFQERFTVVSIFLSRVVERIFRKVEFRRALLVNLIGASVILIFYWVLYKRIQYDPFETLLAAIERDHSVMRRSDAIDFWWFMDVGSCNLIAFLLGVGVVGTTLWLRQFFRAAWDGIRNRGFDLFCLVFLPALLVISFGRMFTFEVERIWLFLVPFIVIAAAKNIVRDNGRVKWTLLGTAMVLLFAQAWMTEWLFYTYW